MRRGSSHRIFPFTFDPGRYWEQASDQLRKTAAGAFAVRYGQYAVLPLLAIAGGLAPSQFGIRWTFTILVVVMFALLRSKSGLFGLAVLAAMLVYLPQRMDTFERGIMFDIALYALLGIGLNVVVGYAGLLDLGYVAFFACGAYLYALIAAPQFGGGFDVGTSFWIVLPMAMVLAALVGIALGIPVLRLRGDYLAIVTLGFGEIIRIMINNQDGVTNGPVGVFAIPKPHFGGRELSGPFELYFVVLAGCFVAAFAAERIRDSRVGRAWEAIREDEDVASSMGVNTTAYKLMAFAIGAAIGGGGGVMYSAKQSAVFPSDFNLDVSINVLALVIIGGMGNVRGVILGAMLLIGLPEVLRDFSIDVAFIHLENLGADYRLVIFGAALVAVMVLRPEGLLPSRRRAAEFEQAELLESELAT
jgi:branched-chain amino acid transport system permease protein